MESSRRGVLVLTVVTAMALGLGIGVVGAQVEWFVAVIVLPIAVLVGLKRPEWVLAAFLYAGAFKAVVPLPFDLTVVLALSVILLALFALGREGMAPLTVPIWLFVVFGVLVLTGLLTGGVTAYGVEKATRFVVLGFTAFFGTLLIIRSEERVLSFMNATIVLGVIMAGYAVLSGGTTETAGRLVAFGSNTIALGRAAALAVVGAAVHTLWKPASIVWAGPTAVLSLWALAGSGSRGPTVAALAAIAVLVAYRLWTRGAKTWLIVAFSTAMGAVATAAWAYLPRASTARFERVLGGVLGGSEVSRLALYSQATSLIKANWLFGIGTGRFAEYAAPFLYPHNMVLEVLSENGLLGLFTLIASLMTAFVRAFRAALRCPGPASDFIVVALILSFVNAMVSGDLNDNRLLYAFMAIALSTVFTAADEPESSLQ